MVANILKCPDCGSYGLSKECSCGASRSSPKPAKYSPEDRYGVYRRKAKKGGIDGSTVADKTNQPGY